MRYLVYACIGLIIGSSGIACASTTVPLPEIGEDESAQVLPVTAKAIVGDAEIKLEVATTPEQMAKGVMFRSDLPSDRGMLFPIAPPREVQFWMKNVQIPLDILFIRDGQVQSIAPNVPGCASLSESSFDDCPRVRSTGRVDQVLEVPAGTAQSLGLSSDDEIEIVFLEIKE